MSVLPANTSYSNSGYPACANCNTSASISPRARNEDGSSEHQGLITLGLQQEKEALSIADKIFSLLFRQNASAPPRPTLKASLNEKSEVEVTTEDGYTICFKGKRQEWTLTSPDATTTRIWGDPHVEESDGDTWDFSKQSSFVFGNNKITVETVEAANGAFYTKTVTIYNGEDRFTLSGIDTNELELVDWTFDAEIHDAELDDGEVYRLEKEEGNGEAWRREESGE